MEYSIFALSVTMAETAEAGNFKSDSSTESFGRIPSCVSVKSSVRPKTVHFPGSSTSNSASVDTDQEKLRAENERFSGTAIFTEALPVPWVTSGTSPSSALRVQGTFALISSVTIPASAVMEAAEETAS